MLHDSSYSVNIIHLFEIPGPGMSRDLGGDDVGEMYTCTLDLACKIHNTQHTSTQANHVRKTWD